MSEDELGVSFDLWFHHPKYATGGGFTFFRDYFQIQIKILGRELLNYEWFGDSPRQRWFVQECEDS